MTNNQINKLCSKSWGMNIYENNQYVFKILVKWWIPPMVGRTLLFESSSPGGLNVT